MTQTLKPYMAFSRGAGASEGAALVFAHNAREARVVGWSSCCWDITDEYIDLGVRLLRGCEWIYKDADPVKLEVGTPHVIDSPKCCRSCEMWGWQPIGEDGFCDDCRNEEESE